MGTGRRGGRKLAYGATDEVERELLSGKRRQDLAERERERERESNSEREKYITPPGGVVINSI